MIKNITIACDNCKHKEVCRFRLEYRSACKALEEAHADLPERADRKNCMCRVCDFSWLANILIVCEHFDAAKNIFTRS